MRLLVLNRGSSTLKYLVRGGGEPERRGVVDGGDRAITASWLAALGPRYLDGVGHRVVHGGERLGEAVVIDQGVLAEIGALAELAPDHNPAVVDGIRTAQAALPGVPMVAVFDTAFHRSLPPRAATYALPIGLAQRHGIRRYGFHGIAHASLVEGYARAAGRPIEQVDLITLQLGGGCSAAAIAAGRPIDTSMGLTPSEGLVMATRCGDLDPGVIAHLVRGGIEIEEVDRLLRQESGLLGLSGRSADMRDLLAAERAGDTDAGLAVDLFCYRARKYIGAYLAALGGAEAVVFGGGIGENAPAVRRRICAGMAWCGLALDERRNEEAVGVGPRAAARISRDDARLAAWVVGVDEEDWIARETQRCLSATTRR